MGWANEALKALDATGEAQVRPLGGSMCGRIESGQLVTIRRVDVDLLASGDVVFVRWKGGFLLHLIKAVNGNRFLIGNNVGKINGWVMRDAVLGKVVRVSA